MERPNPLTEEETRFWSWVNFTDSCWLWTGAPTKPHRPGRKGDGGYGRFSWNGGQVYAHRWAYENYYGNLPRYDSMTGEPLQLDHLCRRRLCVRPDHLQLVTQTENIQRGLSGRWNLIKETCKRGHPFDEENTYIYVNSRGSTIRHCRRCRADYQKMLRAKAAT